MRGHEGTEALQVCDGGGLRRPEIQRLLIAQHNSLTARTQSKGGGQKSRKAWFLDPPHPHLDIFFLEEMNFRTRPNMGHVRGVVRFPDVELNIGSVLDVSDRITALPAK